MFKLRGKKNVGVVSVPLVGRHVVNEPKVGCHVVNELKVALGVGRFVENKPWKP